MKQFNDNVLTPEQFKVMKNQKKLKSEERK